MSCLHRPLPGSARRNAHLTPFPCRQAVLRACATRCVGETQHKAQSTMPQSLPRIGAALGPTPTPSKGLRRGMQAVTRRSLGRWEAEQARVRHAHAAAADAATAAAEARAQAAEAARAECSRLTARVRADRQALQARHQLLATARRGLTERIEKVSPLAVRQTLNIFLLPPPLCPPFWMCTRMAQRLDLMTA